MKEPDSKKLSQLMIKLRKSRDLSRDEMGSLLGVSGRTIRRWENGEQLPTMNDIVHICNEFDLSLEEVFDGQINLDREVNRKLISVDAGIDSINEKITSTDETVSNISNDINDIKEQLEKVSNKTIGANIKETTGNLTWLWLLIIHLVTAAMGISCNVYFRMGYIETFVSSVGYIVAISYLIYRKKDDMKTQRMFLLYSVVLEVTFVLNYVLCDSKTDEFPGILGNLTLSIINGGMYGFCIFNHYMEALLWICIIVYTTWILFCGYQLIANEYGFKENTDTTGNVLKIILAIEICILAIYVPYIKWEIFVSSSTLKQFDNAAFKMICAYFVIAVVSQYLHFLDKRLIKMIIAVSPLFIIWRLIHGIRNISGILSDGTAVTANIEYGFYLIIVLLSVYTIIAVFQAQKTRNEVK